MSRRQNMNEQDNLRLRIKKQYRPCYRPTWLLSHQQGEIGGLLDQLAARVGVVGSPTHLAGGGKGHSTYLSYQGEGHQVCGTLTEVGFEEVRNNSFLACEMA